MQSINWAPEHCEALRENLAKRMSYSEIAEAINAKFSTAYSRSATISRARRMGLAGAARPEDSSRLPPKVSRTMRQRYAALSGWIVPVFAREETVKLRCVETDPRHLSLPELEPGDCRYPYGGDAEGEAITFCGQPCREDSSYCAPHFHLTRGPRQAIETGRHRRAPAGGGGMKREPQPARREQRSREHVLTAKQPVSPGEPRNSRTISQADG
jgi:GcrA cell cycle regulator